MHDKRGFVRLFAMHAWQSEFCQRVCHSCMAKGLPLHARMTMEDLPCMHGKGGFAIHAW